MKLLLLVLALSIASGHVILSSHAQSLAEVAGKERQRREHLKSASRVYTNADLIKYQDESESSSGQGRESKPSVTADTPRKPESEEEFVWSQRFMGSKRRLLELQTQ